MAEKEETGTRAQGRNRLCRKEKAVLMGCHYTRRDRRQCRNETRVGPQCQLLIPPSHFSVTAAVTKASRPMFMESPAVSHLKPGMKGSVGRHTAEPISEEKAGKSLLDVPASHEVRRPPLYTKVGCGGQVPSRVPGIGWNSSRSRPHSDIISPQCLISLVCGTHVYVRHTPPLGAAHILSH
jgi:hypothetical protein